MRIIIYKLNALEEEKVIFFGPPPLNGLQNQAEQQIQKVNLFQ